MAEPKLRSPVRKLAALRPGYLALLFVVLALVLGAFALYGLRQAQQSTLETLERGARSLAEAVSRAEENVLRAEGDMEELVEERLLDNARLLAELGLTQSFSDTLLARIAADNALDQVDVIDATGRLVASSGVVDVEELMEWQRELEPLLGGMEEVLLFELDDQLFAVAVAMRDGGAVIVRAAAERLLHLRIRSGAGRLIQEIGTNQDIVYMALQDTLGLLAASHDLVLLESIDGDAFLETALTRNAAASRLVEFEDEEMFEVVIPFAPQGTTLGLLRIGLSLDELRAQEQRGRLQVALLVLLLLILGAVGTGAVIVRQNWELHTCWDRRARARERAWSQVVYNRGENHTERCGNEIGPKKYIIPAAGMRLERDFAGVGEAQVDADQLHQALLNLLINAVEATDEGHIRLEARSLPEEWVEIGVADTGPGIPAEDVERIFDLYFTTKAAGAGLGLSLVHRIVAEHGGRVEVQSDRGAGARFVILLPRGF